MDVRVEEGKVVATPIRKVREGWAEDAAKVAAAEEDPDEAAWQAFGNDGDDTLTCRSAVKSGWPHWTRPSVVKSRRLGRA